MTRRDVVRPEIAQYVLARDGGCVLALLWSTNKLEQFPGSCRDRLGRMVPGYPVSPWSWELTLTIAHVRDRAGGRTGKRPASIVRRLAAVCWGHHLGDPIVDRADIRPIVDEYLEEQEGPDLDQDRPHEVIRRVRARGVPLPSSDRKGGADGPR